MCLSSGTENHSQLNRFVEGGMPQKIVKTVEYTMKKRAAEVRRAEELEQTVEELSKQIEGNYAHNGNDVTSQRSNVEHVNDTLQIPKMCGRFRKLQQGNSSMPVNGKDNTNADYLSIGTQFTRRVVQHINMGFIHMQQHKLYTTLTKTTQPAHLLALCMLALVLFTVGPDIIGKHNKNITPRNTRNNLIETQYFTSRNDNAAAYHNNNYNNDLYNHDNKIDHETKNNKNENHSLAIILYLGVFATHFGSQIWMTFVSGLSLYFSLPRHTFGQCQQILFPKYFALNAVLSLILVVLFIKYFAYIWNTANCIQLVVLVLSALIEIVVRLYLAPPMLQLMHEKYKIEGAIGSGKEIGNIVQGDLAQCPHYQRIHKMFRRIHMTIAIGNIIVLLASGLHLYFLASKIQIH